MPGVTVTARVTMLERGRRYYVLGGKLPLINSLARRRCGDPVKGAAECASVPTFSANAPLLKMDDTTLLLELRRSMMLFRFEKLFGASIVASRGEIGRIKDVYFDDQRWTARYLVVQTGSWLWTQGPHRADSVHNIDRGRNLIHTELAKLQVEASRASPGSWSWLDAFSRLRMCAGAPLRERRRDTHTSMIDACGRF
jgi:sporulation protein YlmC with PRC-barrel domain